MNLDYAAIARNLTRCQKWFVKSTSISTNTEQLQALQIAQTFMKYGHATIHTHYTTPHAYAIRIFMLAQPLLKN